MQRTAIKMTLRAMDSRAPSSGAGDGGVFMVEAYRAAGSAGPAIASPADRSIARSVPERPTVLAVIDIPGDEVVLIVISASDSASAEGLVQDHGMRPIRVVPVQWDAGSPGVPVMSEPAQAGGTSDKGRRPGRAPKNLR